MRFNTLDQWLDWQASLHPREIELGLERVARVWRRLRPAGLQCPVVTVAGTNGKGSCVAMLDSIYRRAGYHVCVYTSPHLVRYNERIRLGGRPVDDDSLCMTFEAIDRARGDTSLTYFEFGTLAALSLFAEARPELVILEVGLGGRLDAVNIVDADLALITTVDLDHTDWLGESLDAIAREKAGIMRSQRPVILADPQGPEVLLAEAQRQGARASLAGRDFSFRVSPSGWQWLGPDEHPLELPLPALPGAIQLQNAAAVVMACRLLGGRLPVTDTAVAEGIAGVVLPGRMQWLPGSPAVLLDVAHNPQAVASLLSSLSCYPHEGIQAIFGLLKDKDAAGVARLMAERVDGWHLVDLPGGRGRAARDLEEILRSSEVRASIAVYRDFAEAFKGASAAAGADDLVLVFGSFILVGEAMQYLAIE